MYGKRKYGRIKPGQVEPIPASAIPTFHCPRCNKAKSTAAPFTELTVLDKGKLVLYNKLCEACSKALQEWMKSK